MTSGEILEYFKDINLAYNNPNKLDDLKRMLDELCEQKKGKWTKVNRGGVEYTAVCNKCGASTFWSDAPYHRYCHECGAKMEVEHGTN